MPIDRGSSGSDHPPEDDAQRPRDNRPLDFTRPAYRPRHDLPDPRELYKDLFGDADDSSGPSDQSTEADEATEKPSDDRHAERPDEAEATTKPDKPESAVDLPAQHPVDLPSVEDRTGRRSDRIEPVDRHDRLATTTEPADARPGQRELDRPTETAEPQDLGKGVRGWWEVDPAEPEDSTPDRPTSQQTTDPGDRRADKPVEPQEVAQPAPAASTTASQLQPAERVEQPEPPQPDRPQTLDERKAAYWAERGGDTRHFPGWSGPEQGSSESSDQDRPAEPRVSFVWGKVLYHDRDAESEPRSEEAESSSEEQPDAAAPSEGGDTRAEVTGGWDRSENPYSPLGGTRAVFNPEHTPEERQAASAEGVARTTDVLGRKPINASYAGRVFYDGWTDELKAAYPDGVQFSYEAFPEFARYATAIVQLDEGFGPTRKADERRARHAWREQTGEVLDEAGYTWHHHQDGRTLLLVPTDVHDATRHHGGWAISQRLGTRRTDDA